MKFVTENQLRLAYKKKNFDKYKIDKNTRLTPGARQFLNDFRIEILDDESKKINQEKDKESTKIKKDYLNKKIAKELKIFSNKVKNYNFSKSNQLSELSKKIYINEKIDLNQKQINLEDITEIFMNLDLEDPANNLFIEVDLFLNKLHYIKENYEVDRELNDIIEYLTIEVNLFFVKFVNRGGCN